MRIKLQILICCIGFPLLANGQTYPPGFSQVLVANSINRPTSMAFAPDSRIFVTGQDGGLHLIKPGIQTPDTILQLTVNSAGERGLLGIAIDPEFSSNNYLYLYYMATTPILHNRVSRFTLDGDAVIPGSEQIILDLDKSTSATNHNGGGLAFGVDGKLYVSVGDAGERDYGQSLNTYNGKILRINKDGSVPPDNPFASSTRQQTKRIWGYGIRSPFTIAIQPGTGRLFVNDVGLNTYEEIDDATSPGKNFGWSATEGPTTNPDFTSPLYAYLKTGGACALTGGTFFNPDSTNYPSEFYGKYFYVDFCAHWIKVLDFSVNPPVSTSFATNIAGRNLSIKTGVDGNLYFLSYTTGSLYKIVYNNSSPPFIVNHPDSLSVLQREPISFSVDAIGSMPFEYQWQKDNSDITGATSATFSIASVRPSDAGEYRVIISNASGKDTSDIAKLDVTHVNLKPIASITQPESSSTYVAGTGLVFSGTGSDDDDGALGPESFKWEINFYHSGTIERVFATEGITTGTFDIPNEGETSTEVWYRLILTVTDSEGVEDKDSVDVIPATSTITLETNPPGLQVNFKDELLTPPFSVESVEGMLHTLDVPTPQTMNDIPYRFISWSNNGDASQTFATPEADITLTANFSVIVGTEDDFLNKQVTVLSNPVTTDHVKLMITTRRDQTAMMQMTDVRGYQNLNATSLLQSGENEISIFTGTLSAGLYVISVDVDGKRYVRKVLLVK